MILVMGGKTFPGFCYILRAWVAVASKCCQLAFQTQQISVVLELYDDGLSAMVNGKSPKNASFIIITVLFDPTVQQKIYT